MTHKAHGSFKKTINQLTIVTYYDGHPAATTIAKRDQELRLHGVDEAKDLIYALQCMVRDYEDVAAP